MRNKYDQAQDQGMPIVERVLEVAEHHGVPMAQVALAWHWAKGVTAPIVGCSKPERVGRGNGLHAAGRPADRAGAIRSSHRRGHRAVRRRAAPVGTNDAAQRHSRA